VDNTYQEHCYQQEKQEYFDRCVRVAVEAEVKRIINTATCFECDNPLTVLETEDGGITVKECQKCHGLKVPPDVGQYIFNTLSAMNESMARQNGR